VKQRGRHMLLAQYPGKPMGPPPAWLSADMLKIWSELAPLISSVAQASDRGMFAVLTSHLWLWRSGVRSIAELRLLVRLLDEFFIDRAERRRILET
jgi:hypothetical protein